MAEEQTVSTEPQSGGTSSEGTGGIQQSGYLNDAFESWFTDGDKGDATGSEDTEPKTANDNAGDVKVAGQKEPEKQEEQKDLFESAFRNDAGEFDAEKFLSFKMDDLELLSDPVIKPDQKAQQQDSQNKEPDIPAWKKEMLEEQELEKTMRADKTDALEKAYQLIVDGMDPKQALAQVYNEIDATLKESIREKLAQNKYEREKTERDRAAESIKQTQLSERANTNISNIVERLPGKDTAEKRALYDSIMFGKEGGANILNEIFFAQHPDAMSKSPEEQSALAGKFLLNIQADGAKLKRLFNTAFRYYAGNEKYIKQVLSGAVKNKVNEVMSNNSVAQKSGNGTSSRQRASGKPESKSAWEQYFSAPSERIRVN